MEYSITGSEVAELISCKKQDVYNSASYGQMIRKEFYVEVVDRPLSRTKDLTLLLEYDRVCREQQIFNGRMEPKNWHCG